MICWFENAVPFLALASSSLLSDFFDSFFLPHSRYTVRACSLMGGRGGEGGGHSIRVSRASG